MAQMASEFCKVHNPVTTPFYINFLGRSVAEMTKESFTNKNGNYKRLPSDFYYVKYELNNYKEEGSTVYATLAYDID